LIKIDKHEVLIGVLSDTHVPHRTANVPQTIYDDFQRRNVDYVFHLGDFTSLDVYNDLIEIFGEKKVFAVRGNMDFDDQLRKILPEKIEMDIIGHKTLLLHGMGGPNMIVRRLTKKLDLLDSDYDLIIFGHTHRPVNETQDGILFFNPGTTTPIDNKFTVISSYGFLRISKDKIQPEIIIREK
jgi:putative phosphoesterase